MTYAWQNHLSGYNEHHRIDLSIVIPLRNEREVITLTYERLKTTLNQIRISYELVLVDDGSEDGTQSILEKIADNDPFVTAILFDQQFGKESALYSGMSQACGKAIIIMDGDLQDPPELIPDMVAAWREGAEVVLMQPKPRKKSLKNIAHRVFANFLNIVGDIELPEKRMDFMLYSRRVLSALSLSVERKRYMKEIFKWIGARVRTIEYDRHPRPYGSPRWSILEFLGRAPDGSISPAYMAMRGLMSLGILGSLVSILCTITFGIKMLRISIQHISDWAISIWMLLGFGTLYLIAGFVKGAYRSLPPTKHRSCTIKTLLRSQAKMPDHPLDSKRDPNTSRTKIAETRLNWIP